MKHWIWDNVKGWSGIGSKEAVNAPPPSPPGTTLMHTAFGQYNSNAVQKNYVCKSINCNVQLQVHTTLDIYTIYINSDMVEVHYIHFEVIQS